MVIQKYNLNYKSCLLKFAINRCVQKANVGSYNKATRCQQVYVVSYSLLQLLFRHSIAPLKVVDHILRKASQCTIQLPWFQNVLSSSNVQNTVSNNIRMHHTSSLISKFSQQFQLPKNRFKERQNAPFCVFAFNFFSAVPTSRTSF